MNINKKTLQLKKTTIDKILCTNRPKLCRIQELSARLLTGTTNRRKKKNHKPNEVINIFYNELASHFAGNLYDLRVNYFIFVFNANFHGFKCSKQKKKLCYCCCIGWTFFSFFFFMNASNVLCTEPHTHWRGTNRQFGKQKKYLEQMLVFLFEPLVNVSNVCYRSNGSTQHFGLSGFFI